MRTLEIDIETFSSVSLQKCGVYKYAESPDFQIILFGYSVDGGEVKVVDLLQGEAVPQDILNALTDDTVVKWAHNSGFERVCLSRYLADMGVNLFNFSCDHTIEEMLQLTGNSVTLLGNIPPRDVLAQGTPEDVTRSVRELRQSLPDNKRVLYSCGGGMPPGVSTENINAVLNALSE